MTRLKENAMIIDEMNKRARHQPKGTYEEMAMFQLGTIATMLADVSKSLAIIANKEELEEPKNTIQVAKWVNNIHDLPICSKCGNYAVFEKDDYFYSDYCPNCGARMEKGE